MVLVNVDRLLSKGNIKIKPSQDMPTLPCLTEVCAITSNKVVNIHDSFGLLPTAHLPRSAKFSWSYVQACIVLGIFRRSASSNSQLLVQEKIHNIKILLV